MWTSVSVGVVWCCGEAKALKMYPVLAEIAEDWIGISSNVFVTDMTDIGPGFVSMSAARIRRILSKKAGVVRSVREKEEGGFVKRYDCIHTCTCGDWQSLGRRGSPASISVRRPNCCDDRLMSLSLSVCWSLGIQSPSQPQSCSHLSQQISLC